MGSIVLDASIILAVSKETDAHHTAATKAIEAAIKNEHEFILPASVLAEVLVGAARGGRTHLENRRTDTVETFGPLRPIDEEIAVEAAAIRATHPELRLPDAMVFATAVVDDATVLTADKRLADADDRIHLLASDASDSAS